VPKVRKGQGVKEKSKARQTRGGRETKPRILIARLKEAGEAWNQPKTNRKTLNIENIAGSLSSGPLRKRSQRTQVYSKNSKIKMKTIKETHKKKQAKSRSTKPVRGESSKAGKEREVMGTIRDQK